MLFSATVTELPATIKKLLVAGITMERFTPADELSGTAAPGADVNEMVAADEKPVPVTRSKVNALKSNRISV